MGPVLHTIPRVRKPLTPHNADHAEVVIHPRNRYRAGPDAAEAADTTQALSAWLHNGLRVRSQIGTSVAQVSPSVNSLGRFVK